MRELFSLNNHILFMANQGEYNAKPVFYMKWGLICIQRLLPLYDKMKITPNPRQIREFPISVSMTT